MKYVKTKDGKIVKVNLEGDVFTSRYEIIGNPKDTIEELCDEFVLEHPLFANNCKTLYHKFEKAKKGIEKRNDETHKRYNFDIYGAIWTDKGLIYVARMNDEGELELI